MESKWQMLDSLPPLIQLTVQNSAESAIKSLPLLMAKLHVFAKEIPYRAICTEGSRANSQCSEKKQQFLYFFVYGKLNLF